MNETIIVAVVGLVSSLATWWAARRKTRAEVQMSELDNVEKSLKYYRDIVDDLGNKLREATSELYKTSNLHREAIDELTAAKKVIINLEQRLEQLALQNKELINELRKYKQLNGKSE
ncbi:hypothetical protein HX017_11580 [Myroides marinus]|uniref:Cell wall anchor protein n=1 Tax=Myroides marinus TaxID=703342 RepID=A0A164A890_9FLAO|nr:hypothetical protein [Myroides marinus]KUF45536.1 hypothetical protein AS361_06440 [Myroides marinus]KZE83131.1 hypothetical protein AV926_05055 [Myroides marinus]MDM1345672.1 hypothetical protein [Myroides marinus]MDM1351190.1 hypothetical protein [Myroides marinus]MDM1352907.1 hypothetical protein [Myroides marinus]